MLLRLGNFMLLIRRREKDLLKTVNCSLCCRISGLYPSFPPCFCFFFFLAVSFAVNKDRVTEVDVWDGSVGPMTHDPQKRGTSTLRRLRLSSRWDRRREGCWSVTSLPPSHILSFRHRLELSYLWRKNDRCERFVYFFVICSLLLEHLNSNKYR